MPTGDPRDKVGINWGLLDSTTAPIPRPPYVSKWQPSITDVEPIAKSTMEIPIPDPPIPCPVVKQWHPGLDMTKMQADINTLSDKVEDLRHELNLMSLSFWTIVITLFIVKVIKFLGVL